VLPGNRLEDAETDEESCGKCQQNGPGVERNAVERNAVDRGRIGHMWMLLGLIGNTGLLQNFAKKEGN
jgi:hypothetical protein